MKEYLIRILIPLLENIQRKLKKSNLKHSAIGEAIGEIYGYAYNNAKTPHDEMPSGQVVVDENWIKLAIAELESFNGEGDNSLSSVSEATWKVHGIMKFWYPDKKPGKIYFRGQHHSGWGLNSSAQRIGLKPCDENPMSVSQGEVKELRKFQIEVQTDQALSAEIFPNGNILSLESAEWWSIMQHYYGKTRLIDVTSSIYCALFFACADWDGSIDDKNDGVVYLIPQTATGRPATASPKYINGVNHDMQDQLHPLATDYFNVDAHKDTIRFRKSFHRNDRLIAQDGFFLWQPIFDEPLALGQHFKFRIPGKKKVALLHELYLIGYTAQRIIRGSKGVVAHQRIYDTLFTNN